MWHFEDSGKPTGPVPVEEIHSLIAAGRLTRHTRVWREGMSDWRPADQTELAGAFENAPPPLYSPAFVQDDYRYAGFWIRVTAYIIDAFFLDFMLFVPLTIIGVVRQISGGLPNPGALGSILDITVLAGGVLYYAFFTASGWQATPGKRILGLHIIRADGRKIGFALGLGRYLAYIPSSLILGFGFFMIGWSDQKKGLHDIICGTRVVRGRPRVRNLATVFE
jgi:uncharacterized RDD family membrane protein YckC